MAPYVDEVVQALPPAPAPSPSQAPPPTEPTLPAASSGPDHWRTGLSAEQFRRAYDAGELGMGDDAAAAIRVDGLVDRTLEPTSEAYRDAVMQAWSAIAGRPAYVPEVDESFDLDTDLHFAQPWPYISRNPIEIANYFGAVAETLRHIGHTPPARVIEFGSGWGHMALNLAASGYRVTAVDLNPVSVELLRRRAAALHVDLEVERSPFLEFAPSEPVEVILFFEAFHHCDRPFDLLDRCVAALRPGGRLLFVAEALYDDYYAPWGVRPDGGAVLMTASEGWLELGFDRAFFERQLHERGLVTEFHRNEALGAHGTFLLATLPSS